MSSRTPTRSLPEELISIVCDHYAQQRQLGSLAQLMRLNRRTSAYARQALYRQYDFIDNRTSHFLLGAETVCGEYEDGEGLDEDILSAIDCREVDPLDLEPGVRWLRNLRTVRVVEVRDMLYGRDTESLLTLTRSLATRGLLLLPKLEEVNISAQVVKRIHSAEARYPKSTPMDVLIILFLASRITRLRISDSRAFAAPHSYTGLMGATRPFPLPRHPADPIGTLVPPHERDHLSHALIHYMDRTPSLRDLVYERVCPSVPIKPKKGCRHTVSFRPLTPTPPSSQAQASSSTVVPESGDERSYIWEIRQSMVDIVQRSVVQTLSHDPDTENAENTNQDGLAPAPTHSGRQSSWDFVLPFSTDSSQWAGTLRLQVRDSIRRRYEDDPELVEQVLGNMSFQFRDG